MSAHHLRVYLVLGIVCLLSVPAFVPTGVASVATAESGTRVSILVAAGEGPEGALPSAVAAELSTLLRDEAGLRRLRIVPIENGAQLRDAIRGENAEHLVILAHGTLAGIAVGDTLVPWSDLRDDLAASRASSIYVGACDSEELGAVPGKEVHTLFAGEVDHRVVAPQIASDLMRTLPTLDATFEPRFLAYLDARGGLDRYALLILFPERPLATCNEMLETWYMGEDAGSSRGECVYVLSPASTNCHADSERFQAPCTEFTPEQQSRLNAEAAPSSEANYAGTSPSSPGNPSAHSIGSVSWDAIASALAVGWNLKNNNDVTLSVGKDLRPDKCVTIVSAEMFLTGGLDALLKAAAKRIVETAPGKVISGEGSVLALRLCGSLQVDLLRFATQPQAEANVRASGAFDVRASTYGELRTKLQVFRWPREISLGFDTGLSYPISLSISGGVRWCYRTDGSPGGLHWSLSIPFQAGGLGFYAQATAGWAQLGFRHDFTDRWTPTFEATGSCPSGTSLSRPGASGGAASTIGFAPPELPEVYQQLLALGIAEENADATIFHVDEDQQMRLVAGILEIRPGTGTYNAYLADGRLAPLGIPADLPLGSLILLDLTDARVQDALGLARDPTRARVSLVGGVAILAGTTSASPALLEQCLGPVDWNTVAVLHAKLCAGVSSEPMPITRIRGEYGAIVPTPDLAPAGIVTDAFDEAGASAYAQACRDGPLASHPSTVAACQDLRTYSSAISSGGDLQLLTRIHEGFTLLSRPIEAGWLTSSCRLDYRGFNVAGTEGGLDLATPVVHPDGRIEMGHTNSYACMRLDPIAYDGSFVIDTQRVVDELNEGNLVLANLALGGPLRANAAAQKPIESLNGIPDVTGLAWETVCPPLGICGLDPGDDA